MILFILLGITLSFEVPNMFYIFQQQWPGSICEANKCYKDDIGNYKGKTWTIHGLWPSAIDKNGECEDLQFCTKQKYVERRLSKQTQEELDQAWVGFFNPSGKFRNHEWIKHGTCWDEKDDLVPQQVGMSNQEEYFQTALELWHKYNIYQILYDFDITPYANDYYYTDDIKNAIQKVVQADVQLLCTKDKNGNLLLMSVSFCLNEQYQSISCPCPVYGGIPCGKKRSDKVYYRPFKM